jgi:hypothetical protein
VKIINLKQVVCPDDIRKEVHSLSLYSNIYLEELTVSDLLGLQWNCYINLTAVIYGAVHGCMGHILGGANCKEPKLQGG